MHKPVLDAVRLVTPEGIRIDGKLFAAPELAALAGQRVDVAVASPRVVCVVTGSSWFPAADATSLDEEALAEIRAARAAARAGHRAAVQAAKSAVVTSYRASRGAR